jgi:tetratricopeptide (TPR) repeat protein
VTLNNLAAIAQCRGDAHEAESLYRHALAIKERTLGPERPELAPTLNNLALLCAADGRCSEAESLYRRAIALLQAAVSATHPTLVACRENYAALNSPRARPCGPHTLNLAGGAQVRPHSWDWRQHDENVQGPTRSRACED